MQTFSPLKDPVFSFLSKRDAVPQVEMCVIFTAALFLHRDCFSFLVVVLNDVLCLFRIMELDDTCDVRTF